MDAQDDETRRYTDREVRLILKSAVELQQRASDADVSSGGLSLAELEQVAAEVGIDAAILRRAAAAVDADASPDAGGRFLGAATGVVAERAVAAPLDEGGFEELLAVVRGRSGQLGESHHVGRLFGWRGRVDGARAEVSVSPAGPDARRTVVRVRLDLDEVALGHFMLKGALAGIGGGLVSMALAIAALGPAGIGVGGAIAAGGYLWARVGFRGAAARYRARAGEIAAALAARVAERAAAEPPTTAKVDGAGSAPDGRYSPG